MHRVPAIVLALFVTAGLYKHTAFVEKIPADLTVLLGITVAGIVVHKFLSDMSTGKRAAPVLILWAWFLPAILLVSTQYGVEKVGQAYTLTLLASIAPLWLIRNPSNYRAFLWTLTAVSAYLVYLVATGQAIVGDTEASRLTVGDLNTIITGRAIAYGMIWLTVLVASRQIPFLVGTIPAGAMAAVLVATGARGPLVGALLGISVAMLWRANIKAIVGRLLLAGTVALGLYIGYQFAPLGSQERLLTVGTSGDERLRYFGATIDIITAHPVGIGWGNWQPTVGYILAPDAPYPHNLLLEVTAEGGWCAGVALLWFMWRVGRSAMRNCTDTYGRAALAFFLFSTTNLMVSDDLVGARFWFAACAIVLARETWESVNARESSRRASVRLSRRTSPERAPFPSTTRPTIGTSR